jgi:hypothetical protein
MRKLGRWVVGGFVVLVGLWLVTASVAWSRNRVPALDLPMVEPQPQGNIYAEYGRCVNSISDADKQALRTQNALDTLTVAQQEALLTRNRAVLERFHKLVGQPCLVTSLTPDVHFVASQDYPFLAGLIALEGLQLAQTDPDRGLKALLDGLTFAEDVTRGGAIIHLNAGAPSIMPLGRSISVILPKLSADSCRQGAERVHALLDNQYPLAKIYEKERLIRIGYQVSKARPESTALLRFQFPSDSFGWQYLMRPKSSMISAFNAYLLDWTSEATKPVHEIKPPSLPQEVKEQISGETNEPGTLLSIALLYHYKETRLRLIYVGLRLEQYRKTHDQYPPTLTALGQDAYTTDPFSNQPFLYRRDGSDFSLYSVGPNGRDDGDAPEATMRNGLSPGSPGDIAFKPVSVLQQRQR